MLTLVARARRRLFHNELFNQSAHAVTAILIALILLLLLGTQILGWQFLVLISAVAVGLAVYFSWKRRPTLYTAAQVIDRRLSLADTISTAFHFRDDQSTNHASSEIREFQRERAGRVSESVDVRQAVPYRMPRSAYVMTALLLVAGSLFALRYGMLGSLNLQPPLAHVFQQLTDKNRDEVARNNRKQPPQTPEPPDDAGASVNDPEQKSMQPDNSVSDGADASGDSQADKNDSSQGDNKKDGARNAKSNGEGDQDAQAESNPSQSGDNNGQESGKQDQKQQQSGKQDGNNQGENSSLMNKAKDLLQNLLSSIKPPQSNPGNPQQNNDPNNQQSKGQQKQGEKNGQQKSAQKGDQSEGQQGEPGEDQQDQKDQANGKSDSQQASKQPGSGAGNQDGDKRIKQAEDLAAMGKLTEIMGKRSANLTGEATIEVQSTSQQLRTAYAPGGAQHGQSGGQIDRDEIPVAMQPFVQEYFKQARKQAPAANTPASTTAAGTKKQ